MTINSLFPSVTNKWPFQDNLPCTTLLIPRTRFHSVSEFKDKLSYISLEFIVHIYYCLIVFQIQSLLLCHCTHIWHVTKQIWLPHCKWESHNHHTEWENKPFIFSYTCQNYYNIYFTSLPCMCQKQICPSNASYIPIYANKFMYR